MFPAIGRVALPAHPSTASQLDMPDRSNSATIVSPMKQSLSLTRPARRVSRFTVLLDLRAMPSDVLPTFDLGGIFFGHAATHVIAAIPLEPASRVLFMDPAALSPN